MNKYSEIKITYYKSIKQKVSFKIFQKFNKKIAKCSQSE